MGAAAAARSGASASTRSRASFFKRGEAEFFIAWRDGAAGRHDLRRGGPRRRTPSAGDHECVFGFFNFIEDYAVMEALLAARPRVGA